MRVVDFNDFRGGYFTNVPAPLVAQNEALVAQNCYWKDGLVKRKGIRKYSTTALTGTIKGAVRTRLNSTYYTLMAIDSGSSVKFFAGTTATIGSISAYTFTTGKDAVSFSDLNGHIVACNGFDKPVVIRNTGAWSIQTIDAFDTRTVSINDWWAGQYDDDGGTKYVNDTTDAQSDTTQDFGLATTSANDGFWIASDEQFNKVVFTEAAAFTGAPVVSYQYWNGSAWSALTTVSAPTWTDAKADKTLEFDIPTDWAVTSSTVENASYITNRFSVRARFTTAPSNTPMCDKLALSNTQKFTEIVSDEKPLYSTAHASRVWFSFKDSVYVNYSRPNVLTGWRAEEYEYFEEGGSSVKGLASYSGNLIVFKDNGMYQYSGNNFNNFIKRRVSDKGTVSHRSAAVVGSYLFRACDDGIWVWDGIKDVKVSAHIQDDYDGWTKTDASAAEHEGWYWLSFPSDGITLVCDPDTMRQDSMGTWRVSLFKLSNYRVDEFVKANESGDIGMFFGVSNKATPYIARLENGYTDETPTATNITMTYESAALLDSGYVRRFLRFKPTLFDVSNSGGIAHTFTLYSDWDARNTAFTVNAGTGSNYTRSDLSLPYTADGNNIRVKMTHASAYRAGLIGFSIGHEERRF